MTKKKTASSRFFSYFKGVRNRDLFGHNIALNFNKRGHTHKTMIGGFFSIIVKTIIYGYIGITMKQMLFLEENKNESIKSLIDLEELGMQNFKDAHLTTFQTLKNGETGDRINLTEDLKRYIDISYQHVKTTHYQSADNTRMSKEVTTRMEPRTCGKGDFSSHQTNKQFQNLLDGFDLVCPSTNDFNLYQNEFSQTSQTLRSQIAVCNDATNKERGITNYTCADPAEIIKFVNQIQIEHWVVQASIDFALQTDFPVFMNMDRIYSNYLRYDEMLGYDIMISRHLLRLWDHFLRFSHLGETNAEYYNIQSLNHANKRRYPGNDVVYKFEINLSDRQTEHTRKIFGWLDLLGKLGGITNVCMMMFGFFLFPIAEHSYTLKAAKKFFLARTRDNTLFKEDPRHIIKTKALSSKSQEELQLHHAIKFHKKDNWCLFASHQLGCLFPSKLWPNKDKFQKMYRMTNERINTQLNIVKMVKTIRYQKALSKHSLMTPLVKQQLIHQEKNLINLEETSEFDSEAPSCETQPIELSEERKRSNFNSEESEQDIVNMLEDALIPQKSLVSQDDTNIEARTQNQMITPGRENALVSLNKLNSIRQHKHEQNCGETRDYEVMRKQQTNVLINLNKSLTNRPSIRKLKAKRLAVKIAQQDILKYILRRKKRDRPMTQEEAVSVISRFFRKRWQTNPFQQPRELSPNLLNNDLLAVRPQEGLTGELDMMVTNNPSLYSFNINDSNMELSQILKGNPNRGNKEDITDRLDQLESSMMKAPLQRNSKTIRSQLSDN